MVMVWLSIEVEEGGGESNWGWRWIDEERLGLIFPFLLFYDVKYISKEKGENQLFVYVSLEGERIKWHQLMLLGDLCGLGQFVPKMERTFLFTLGVAI